MVLDVHQSIKPQRHARRDDLYNAPVMAVAGGTAAYLRKSRVTGPNHLSWEMQQAEILRLAQRDGNEPIVLSDWNRSGRAGKEDRRPGYQTLVGLIKAREITTIYAYDRSRLTRSVQELAKLAQLCADNGVMIRTAKEGDLDYVSSDGRMVVNILGSVAQQQAESAQVRARDAVRVRRDRGDLIGQLDYGWMRDPDDRSKKVRNPNESLERVVELYRETRSLLATAKRLNAEGQRARRGGLWSSTSVRAIIDRAAPELLPARTQRGVKPQAPFAFFRLLRCHCGTVMTGSREYYPDGRIRHLRYVCMNGSRLADHGKTSVTERKIRDWAKTAVADHIAALPKGKVQVAGDNAAERDRLETQKRTVAMTWTRAGVPAAEINAEIDRLDHELEKLIIASRRDPVPPAIVWDGGVKGLAWTEVEINSVLRTIWSAVELGPDLLPVRALPA